MTILTPAAPPRGYRRRRRRQDGGSLAIEARRTRRITGGLGLLFVALAGAGAALIELPDAGAAAQVTAYIVDHRLEVLVSQALAIGAALLFFAFAARLTHSVGFGENGALAWTGGGVAAAALALALAVAAMGLLAATDRIGVIEDLLSLHTGLSVLLALAVASFGGAVAFNDSELPTLVRFAGGVTAVLAVGTAFATWAEVTTSMQSAAPILFLLFVAMLAGWLVVGRDADRTGRG